MLQRVEHEVGLARGFGMGVDGDYAALFVELVERTDRRAIRDRRRSGCGSSHAWNALIETLGHAVTVSTLRVDSRALDHADSQVLRQSRIASAEFDELSPILCPLQSISPSRDGAEPAVSPAIADLLDQHSSQAHADDLREHSRERVRDRDRQCDSCSMNARRLQCRWRSSLRRAQRRCRHRKYRARNGQVRASASSPEHLCSSASAVKIERGRLAPSSSERSSCAYSDEPNSRREV